MSTFPSSTRPSPLRSGPTSAESPPPHTGYDPPPEIAQAVIDDLVDSFKSFHAIATDRGTTIEGLALWMQRPDIARRLDAVQSASARRSCIMASAYLPSCVYAVGSAVTTLSNEIIRASSEPSTPIQQEQYRKGRETLIRLTRVMMQLSKFEHAKTAEPALPRPADRPTAPDDSRTSNSPARVAAPTAPRAAEFLERRGDVAPPRVVSTDQSQSTSGRAPQPDQRVLASV
ncbi:MAG: hypothetical protein J0L78_15935 [Planctomycetes bacterium]|nr:hypothetical protein [Planctomycetota bacterium]